jgi:hypothetical protein
MPPQQKHKSGTKLEMMTVFQKVPSPLLIAIMAGALAGCGSSSSPAGKADTEQGGGQAAAAIAKGKSLTGGAANALLSDPKVGDVYAVDGNKFLLEYDPSTPVDTDPAFTIMRVTTVTGTTLGLDTYGEVFSDPVDLDGTHADGLLLKADRYDNDPDTILRSRITDWHKKGIVMSVFRP